jgi:hypothetical protein
MTNETVLRFQHENAADYGYDLHLYADATLHAEAVDGISETKRNIKTTIDPDLASALRDRLWVAFADFESRSPMHQGLANVILCVNSSGVAAVDDFSDNICPGELRDIKSRTLVVDGSGNVRPYTRDDGPITGSWREFGEWFHRLLQRSEAKNRSYELKIHRDDSLELDEQLVAEESDSQESARTSADIQDRLWMDYKVEEAMNQFLLARGEFSHTILSGTRQGRRKVIGYTDAVSTTAFEEMEGELLNLALEVTRGVEPRPFT